MYYTRFGKLVNSKKQAQAKATSFPDPAKKGIRNGNCNRTDCQNPGATYYSVFTRAWYCGECAHMINSANRDDTFRMYGVTRAVFQPSKITAEDRAKLEAAGQYVPKE